MPKWKRVARKPPPDNAKPMRCMMTPYHGREVGRGWPYRRTMPEENSIEMHILRMYSRATYYRESRMQWNNCTGIAGWLGCY